jgi:hypothetical protein
MRACSGLSAAKCDMPRLQPAIHAQAIGCQDMQPGVSEAGKSEAGGMIRAATLAVELRAKRLAAVITSTCSICPVIDSHYH